MRDSLDDTLREFANRQPDLIGKALVGGRPVARPGGAGQAHWKTSGKLNEIEAKDGPSDDSGPPGDDVIHRCPPSGSGIMPCCGRTPFEVPRSDRMTMDARLVTCGVDAPGEAGGAGPSNGAKRRTRAGRAAGGAITVVLPLPDKALSPNSRVHYMKRAKATQAARQRAWANAWGYVQQVPHSAPPRWTTATASVVWYHRTLRFPDPQNAIAWLKAYGDGLEDAGIVVNDRGLTWAVRFEKDAKNPRVEITVQERGAA